MRATAAAPIVADILGAQHTYASLARASGADSRYVLKTWGIPRQR